MRRIGFTGLGVMGGLVCRNLVLESGARNADGWLRQAIEDGDGEIYFQVASRLIGRKH